MKLSVVIPFYNEIDLIHKTIESVLINLDIISKFQIILINDGNIDEAKIRKCFDESQNKLITIKSNIFAKGPGGARNTGLEIADGEIIAFLDADDCWLEGKLKAQMLEIEKGASFVTTSYKFIGRSTIIHPPHSINNPNEIFLKRGIGTSTILITKELLEDNRFNEIRFGQDIDFWFNLAKSKKFKYACVSKTFVEYNPNGSTKNKWIQLYYVNKVLSINKVNIITRIKFNISYIVSGIYNHYLRKIFSNKN